MAALRLLSDLEQAPRPALPDEQAVLARWSGWGAVPAVFDEADDRYAAAREEMRALVTDDEWAAARRTTLNAHYTDPSVVMAMWDGLAQLGFTSGRVLEPGCGSGHFIGFAEGRGAEMIGVERDPTSARIAQALYPDADIHNVEFQRFDLADPVDAVIGNVPFAKTTPFDPRHNRGKHSLHSYFLIKSLALTRPHGVMLALTSRYTMDARNPAARRELAQYADLVGALRLPGGAMRAVAGTEAVIDLLVLRRRQPGSDPHPDLPAWDRVVDVEVDSESTGEPATVQMNRYFAERPDRVLGVTVAGRGMYRDGELMVRGDLDRVGEQVAGGLGAMIDASPLRHTPAPPPSPVAAARSRRRIGDVEVAGERLVPLREDSFVVSRSGVIYRHSAGELTPAEVPQSTRHEVIDLVRLRDATLNLLHLESNDAPDADIETERAELRTRYERYRHRWGPLNRVKWGPTGTIDPATGEEKRRRIAPRLGGFREDPDWPTVSAVEVYDPDLDVANTAAIQRDRTIHPPRRQLGADTAEEALAISLDETGTVDVARIAELLGVDVVTARDELGDRVFTHPDSGAVVAAEEYLSGNVRAKLAAAKSAADRDRTFARNVTALEAVHPVDLTAEDISARPGATWIEPPDVETFMAEVLDIDGATVRFIGELGRWHVDVPEGRRRGGLLSDWGTGRVSPERLFDACLNQRMIKVYDRLDDDTRVVNEAETAAARDMQERISERFGAWLWEEPERARRAAARYNELFNSYVAPSYDGNHLTFPGLAATFVPHPHQRSAVARILRDGRCLLAHAVGAGKTATMVMAGIELRRLGLVNQPAYVVPNHMLEQFSRELLQLYPHARVLITSKDLTGREGRKRFIARCATGDWDAVVVTHSAFERLPLREDTYRAYTSEQLARLHAALTQAQATDGDSKKSMTVKRIEEAVERAENRLERLLATASKDDGVSFEESGIDHLFVDELHLFKNKAVVSSIEGMRNTAGSRRATDLDAKLWALRREHGHRVLVGATATPIANSIVECWIMQSYLQPDVLAETGLDNFDSWAATFGQTVSAVELAPDGGSYRVTSRLARYRNVPELIAGFRRTADVLVRSDLALKLPTLEDDKPAVAVVPASNELTVYVEDLVARSEAIKNRRVEPDEDNMLKVTGDGRHAALDLRLVDREPDPQGGKIEVAASRIATVHRSTRHLTFLDDSGEPAPRPGGFQLVFCDLSTPQAGGAWSAYAELRRRLVAHGVPAGEIAFIHDAKTDEARAQLFARCRSGQIAVLIGSTQKMGVGTNIHTRAVALHHLDCPWRPADIEQREGRIIRQGNQNDEVLVVRYATEGSFDVYMWQTCERKAGFIDQVMRGQIDAREMDDIGDAALSYAEVKALATGDPRVLEQFGLQADLAKLERRARAHRDDQYRVQRLAETARRDAAAHRAAAEAATAALGRRTDTRADNFRMEIDGHVHTSRADAGAVLFNKAETLIGELRHRQGRDETRLHTIGRLAGFSITAQGVKSPHDSFLIEAHITVDLGADDANIVVRLNADDLQSRVAEKVITGLETSIRNLDLLADRHLDRAATDDQAATEAEARLRPFPDQPQLDDLRRRYDQLLAELNEATEGIDDVAEVPPEPAADRVASAAPANPEGHRGSRVARAIDPVGHAAGNDGARGPAIGL